MENQSFIFMQKQFGGHPARSLCTFVLESFTYPCTCLFQVELKEGPLEQFTHEMEPFLRKQGMPVRLNKGFYFLLYGEHLQPKYLRNMNI